MVHSCVVYGCSNTPSNKLTLHSFPKDASLLKQWETFVNNTRVWGKSTPSSKICSHHFKPEDFENYVRVSLGGATMLRLRHGAIPSIYPEGTLITYAKKVKKNKTHVPVKRNGRKRAAKRASFV